MHVNRVGSSFVLATVLLLAFACGALHRGSSSERTVGFRGQSRDGVFQSAVPKRRPELAWSVATDGPVRSTPIWVDGDIVFGSGDRTLRSVGAANGRERWRYEADGAIDAAAASARGIVVAASRDGMLHAVDARSGARRWRLDLGDDLPFEWDFEFFLSSPVIEGERVFVGSGAGEILCATLDDGRVLWRHKTGGRVRATPAVADGVVYAPSFDGRLYALDASDGQVIWTFDTRGVSIDSHAAGFDRRSIQSSPAVTPDLVLFGSRDAGFYAVDRHTGLERWSVDYEPSWVVSSPAIAGSRVVVGTSDAHVVECFELADGKREWSKRFESFSQPSPALAGDVVVTGEGHGSVAALDLATGRELWRFATGGTVYSSPLVHDGRIFIGSDDGRLHCLAGDLAAPASTALRAVYYDRMVIYRDFLGDRELRMVLAAASYETLNRTNVAAFLEARLEDRQPSVIVFATDALPKTLLDSNSGDRSLLRRYLDAGGKVVWPGGIPFLLRFDPNSGAFDEVGVADLTRFRDELSFEEDCALEGSSRTHATELGRRWGMPTGWWMSQAPIAPKASAPIEALAVDEHGHVSAWVRPFGGAEGTGFVRCWGLELPLPDPDVVLRLAEYGLP